MQSRPAPDAWPEHAFEAVDVCPWCSGRQLTRSVQGARDWFFEAVPGTFDFASCADCASLVLLRRPVPEFLPAAYANYYTHDDTAPVTKPTQGLANRIKTAISSAYVRTRYGRQNGLVDNALGRFYRLFDERRREIDVYFRFLPTSAGTVLDYGCGNGTFLDRARGHGHRVYGVDFDPGAIEAAAKKGIAVVLPDAVANVLEHGPFDHISAAHVIEHVADPKGLLADFRTWMKPGGTLFLELPNAHAEGLARYGHFWRGLEAPRHFSLPSRKVLSEALEEAGFGSVVFHRRDVVKSWLWAQSDAARRDFGADSEAMPQAGQGEEEFLTVTAQAV